MSKIIKLSNTIKYDYDKCNQCGKCVYSCDNKALCLYDNKIELKKEYCISCKRCIDVCKFNALYYNINDGIIEGTNTIAIIPYDADKRLINKKYGNIITYELGEKVKVIETAFEMEKLTSSKINNEPTKPLIISDILNIDLIIKHFYPQLDHYLSKVKNVYYLSSYLTRLQEKNNNLKVVEYAVPFEVKSFFEEIKITDEICDIPYKINHKYNILDILNTYISLCKLESNMNINNIQIQNNLVIELYNKYVKVKILFLTDINQLNSLDYSSYDFILICKENRYSLNENILKDNEVNLLYKKILKEPGKTPALLRKE